MLVRESGRRKRRGSRREEGGRKARRKASARLVRASRLTRKWLAGLKCQGLAAAAPREAKKVARPWVAGCRPLGQTLEAAGGQKGELRACDARCRRAGPESPAAPRVPAARKVKPTGRRCPFRLPLPTARHDTTPLLRANHTLARTQTPAALSQSLVVSRQLSLLVTPPRDCRCCCCRMRRRPRRMNREGCGVRRVSGTGCRNLGVGARGRRGVDGMMGETCDTGSRMTRNGVGAAPDAQARGLAAR